VLEAGMSGLGDIIALKAYKNQLRQQERRPFS